MNNEIETDNIIILTFKVFVILLIDSNILVLDVTVK